MHLDCSCALVRPLDGQPHQSPSAGILYYPELLGFSLPENPSLVFASGGRGETARVRVGRWAPRTTYHLSTMQNPPSSILHFAVRASPSTVYARGRATSHWPSRLSYEGARTRNFF